MFIKSHKKYINKNFFDLRCVSELRDVVWERMREMLTPLAPDLDCFVMRTVSVSAEEFCNKWDTFLLEHQPVYCSPAKIPQCSWPKKHPHQIPEDSDAYPKALDLPLKNRVRGVNIHINIHRTEICSTRLRLWRAPGLIFPGLINPRNYILHITQCSSHFDTSLGVYFLTFYGSFCSQLSCVRYEMLLSPLSNSPSRAHNRRDKRELCSRVRFCLDALDYQSCNFI